MADRIVVAVPHHLDGERLDRTLASVLGLSRAQARQLVEEGVSVDGIVGRPASRVRSGSRIECPEPQLTVAMAPEDVPFDVLYEDSGLLIVDKPAGVVVHPGSGRKMGTLAAGLLYRYPDLEGVGQADRWGLVHRLDRDTSGALIVARTADTYESLSRMIRDRAVKRVYTTLVHGLFGSPTGMIDAPIGRDPSRPTRRAVVPGGKDARTHYEVSADYPVADCSLLTVRLETGRTHQIRVHLEAIDHPVVGDHTYSRRTTTVRPPRIFLHAASVEFPHPVTGVPVSAVSPLPPDLAAVLEELAQPAV